MRGLTPAERHQLATWVVNSDAEQSDLPALQSLVASGRVTVERVDGKPYWTRTAFAHLALRVCPVGEF